MRKNENNIIFNVRNITLNLKNITTYFTGKEKIITLVSIIIMLSFINIILCSSNIFYNSNVSALTYQTSTNIGFTFRPTLNVSLSNNNLVIDNLIPGGEAKDSNIATVNVSTNIAEGYNLFATVGSDNSNNTSSGYNTTNLVNMVDNNYTFTPLSSNVSELSNFTNNTWGYSYSLDSGTTWISGDYDNASTGYNGLPLYTDTGIKLVEKADSTNSTVNFKIAAKASSTQPSGAYTNTINFTVVSNVMPTSLLDAFIAHNASMYNGYFAMQDMTSEICKSVDIEESELQLIDLRDNKLYWVAKLKDGNCWMTQNLDLDLSHEVALTSETSDIDPDSYGKAIYTTETGYSKDENTGVVSWLPERSTYTSTSSPGSTNWAGDTGDNSTSGYYHPYSWNRVNNSSEPVYPDNTVTEAIAGNHAQSGNYYNWSAAITSNNSLDASGSQKNSICPKSWRLPTSSRYSTLYGIYRAAGNSGNAFGFMVRPLWFVRSGFINNSGILSDSNNLGLYWTNTIWNTTDSYLLYFSSNYVLPNGNLKRSYGFSIRCLAQ